MACASMHPPEHHDSQLGAKRWQALMRGNICGSVTDPGRGDWNRRMDVPNRVLGLIEQLYAAPGTAAGWQTFLNSFCRVFDGSAASLISHDLQSDRGNITANAQMPADVLGSYNGALNRTAYDSDFARLSDIVRTVAGVVELGPDALTIISISGGERRPPFGEAEAALLDLLVPHVRRAVQLHRRLLVADSQAEDFASVINSSRSAVLLINITGQVMFASQAASRLAAMRDGLTMEHGELCAARARDTARLRSLVADAASASCSDGLSRCGVLSLGRPSGRRPLAVLVCPVSRRNAVFPGMEAAVAVVLVTDPEHVEVLDEDALRALFELTSAEATLTRLLAQGVTLREAGDRLGVRRETLRKRLKIIFKKTNTHRQTELVRLIVNGTPRI